MKEVTESRFDQAFPLETYLMNTDGYAGQGDILTKFGVRVTDEATFVISKDSSIGSPHFNFGNMSETTLLTLGSFE